MASCSAGTVKNLCHEIVGKLSRSSSRLKIKRELLALHSDYQRVHSQVRQLVEASPLYPLLQINFGGGQSPLLVQIFNTLFAGTRLVYEIQRIFTMQQWPLVYADEKIDTALTSVLQLVQQATTLRTKCNRNARVAALATQSQSILTNVLQVQNRLVELRTILRATTVYQIQLEEQRQPNLRVQRARERRRREQAAQARADRERAQREQAAQTQAEALAEMQAAQEAALIAFADEMTPTAPPAEQAQNPAPSAPPAEEVAGYEPTAPTAPELDVFDDSDCPICAEHIDRDKQVVVMSCCDERQFVCEACYPVYVRDRGQCPFCRHANPSIRRMSHAEYVVQSAR